MEVIDIPVTGRRSLTLPWDEVQIMPIGDVQLGSNGLDTERLQKQISWAIDEEVKGHPPVYFLGMGDYIDLLSPSNRQAWRSAALYDSARKALEEKASNYEELFISMMTGTKGRWLGVLQGHHFFEHEDGSTSDTRIARALGAPFLGTCAFVRLSFRHPNHNTRLKCTIWCHHGAGSGMMPSAPINKLVPIMYSFEADIYLIGHQTKKPVAKMPRIYMSNKPPYKLVARNKVLAGTGGFTKGYEMGSRNEAGRPEGSYIEKAMMTPVSLGGILVKVRPVFNGTSGDRVDINVEV